MGRGTRVGQMLRQVVKQPGGGGGFEVFARSQQCHPCECHFGTPREDQMRSTPPKHKPVAVNKKEKKNRNVLENVSHPGSGAREDNHPCFRFKAGFQFFYLLLGTTYESPTFIDFDQPPLVPPHDSLLSVLVSCGRMQLPDNCGFRKHVVDTLAGFSSQCYQHEAAHVPTASSISSPDCFQCETREVIERHEISEKRFISIRGEKGGKAQQILQNLPS
jgi:hypothetical protein